MAQDKYSCATWGLWFTILQIFSPMQGEDVNKQFTVFCMGCLPFIDLWYELTNKHVHSSVKIVK